MPKRRLEDWISAYLKYTENTEPPLSYHLWVANSVIAGALERKVYMRWGHSRIFPNQYVVLVGPSGQSRKGEAIAIGKKFLEKIGVYIASEKISKEALIRFMKQSMRNFTDSDTGMIKQQCAITHISEELSVFIGQKDVALLADMTNWYDSRETWTYETKHQGIDKVVGMAYNFLAGTAPDWLPSILPQEAIGGGWTSRTMFIVEKEKGKTVADPEMYRPDEELEENLLHDLELINNITGQMLFDDDARQLYIDWYQREEKKLKEGIWPVPDPRFAGYASRRATHIKKISMAMSASRGDDCIITAQDFKRALAMMEAAEKKMSRVFSGIGKARFAEVTEAVLDYLIAVRKIKRSTLLQKFFRDIDAYTLEQIEKVLSQMKVLKITRDTEIGDTIYEYQPPDGT